MIFSLHLAKSGEGVSITVRTLDVRSGKQIREAVEQASFDEDEVKRATRWAVLKASSPIMTSLLKGKGKLQVSCEEADAELLLNGKSFGKRTNKSFKVGTGVFDIQVKKKGYSTFHDVVAVRPAQQVKVEAVLKSKGPKKVPMLATAPEEQVHKEKKPAADLPAWAVFEKKSDNPDSNIHGNATAKTKDSGASSSAANTSTTKPFIPGDENLMNTPVDKIDEDKDKWYTTWWFWTAVGVVAAGGVAGGLYAAGVFEGSAGSSATGAAAITWQ